MVLGLVVSGKTAVAGTATGTVGEGIGVAAKVGTTAAAACVGKPAVP